MFDNMTGLGEVVDIVIGVAQSLVLSFSVQLIRVTTSRSDVYNIQVGIE